MIKRIPLSIPNFEGNEKEYVDEAICQGWVSTGGAYINKLEKNLASFLHTHSVVACQSGTSAIHLALIEAGVVPGDVVIAPTLTFIAAINPIKYQFATPVFIDCDDSLTLDPVKLEEFCREECEFDGKLLYYNGKVVKVIIVVHVFGNMADMVSLLKVADRYHIKIIEDATEALGTQYLDGPLKGKCAGTIGDFGCYSFNGNKIITTGGGGAVTAKNIEQVEHIRYLSTQAKDDSQYYIHNEVGYNYRMTNLQAALGVAQLEELPEFIRRKQANYDIYKESFMKFELGSIMDFREGVFSNKWFYSFDVDIDKVDVDLRTIIDSLQQKGIETRAVWGLISDQKPYEREASFKIEKARYYSNRILNLPSSTHINEDEIQYVVKMVKSVLEEHYHEN